MNTNYDVKEKVRMVPMMNHIFETECELERKAFLREMDKRFKKEWSEVTELDLLEMCEDGHLIDRDIADYYNVSVEEVRYKRRRFNINRRDIMLGQALRKMFNNKEQK